MSPYCPRPTILLTGFGPFPSVPVNASWQLVERLAPAARRAFPGYRFEAHMLSTEWHGGTHRLVELLDATRPVVALHFGVSRKASGFVIETRGYNEHSAVVDACGVTPEAGNCLVHDAPATLSAQLPASLIAHRLRHHSLPVEISRDAGRYLCNAALYHSLEVARRHGGGVRAGFIHLPLSIDERRHVGGSRLTMPRAITGGLEIIGACLGETAVPGRTVYSEARRPCSALLRN
jgi:pyroglutamyl-peptidase